MTRLARDRDTHLTPREIAVEALRAFDEGSSAPSIRQLAAALQVTPSAIYHRYPSRATIVQAAIELVWQEATEEVLRLVPNPFEAEPIEVLVASGVATRRTFLRHYRIAPYVSATPAESNHMAMTLAMMANVLERLGLKGEEAAACFHTYSSLVLGGVVFAAERRIAHDVLQMADVDREARFKSNTSAGAAALSSPETRAAIDNIVDISTVDPERDEELFAAGLRRLIASFVAKAQATAAADDA